MQLPQKDPPTVDHRIQSGVHNTIPPSSDHAPRFKMKLSSILALLAAPLGGASAFIGPSSTAPSTVAKKSSTSLQTASGLIPPGEGPNMFQAMGNLWDREVASAFASEDDVVIEPDFTLPWLFILSGAFIYFQNLGELNKYCTSQQ